MKAYRARKSGIDTTLPKVTEVTEVKTLPIVTSKVSAPVYFRKPPEETPLTIRQFVEVFSRLLKEKPEMVTGVDGWQMLINVYGDGGFIQPTADGGLEWQPPQIMK